MQFVRNNVDKTPINDTVFEIVALAKKAKEKYGSENVIDATIGSLFSEDGHLVALKSVYASYNQITNEKKAAYADSFSGNSSYRQQVYDWVIKDNCNQMAHSVIATPGGSGAISLTISQLMNQNETLVIPNIAWGSYQLMASMFNVCCLPYTLFEDDHFNLESFKEICQIVISKDHKLCVILNDPAHNPTGYSLSYQEWAAIIDFLNEIGKDYPIVLLNDIAYMDYGFNQENIRKYFKLFNKCRANIMIIIAFSCSKSLTAYGLRCGGAIILNQESSNVREVEIVFEKAARAIWSNIPNAAMDNFTAVTMEHKSAYLEEKQKYIELLKMRSKIFREQCDEVNLKYYPFKEGFFMTVALETNALRDEFHQALMANNIFCVKVNLGIRVAICSLSLKQCDKLAYKMHDVLVQCNKEKQD